MLLAKNVIATLCLWADCL